MAVLVVVSAGVAVLAWRAASRLNAVAFGLVLDGTLGNLIDIAISAGAVLLLAEAIRPTAAEGTGPPPPHAR